MKTRMIFSLNRIVAPAVVLFAFAMIAHAEASSRQARAFEIAVDAASGVVYVKQSGEAPEGRADVVDIHSGEVKGEARPDAIPSDAARFRATPVEENGFVKLVASEISAAAPESMIEIASGSSDPADQKLQGTSGTAAGLTAGLLTGLGFAYRKFFENGWGFHVGFGGIGDRTSIDANVGIELLRVLDETTKSRFYALAGTSVYYSRDRVWHPTEPVDPNAPKPEHPSDSATGETVYQNSALYNFGVGIGLEWTPTAMNQKGIAFAIELPISLMLRHTEREGVLLDGVRPIPSAAIIYYFRR